MNTNHRTLWVTRTGLLLALVLAAQFIGKLVPGGAAVIGPMSMAQLVTGSLVNLLLVLAAAVAGISSGVAVGVLSALLATLLGIGPPFPQLTPVIAVGNVLLVVVAGLAFRLKPKSGDGPAALTAPVLLLGGTAKCAFLWVGIPFALTLLPDMKPPQIHAISLMFSWPQLITAVIGCLLALAVLRPLRRALAK